MRRLSVVPLLVCAGLLAACGGAGEDGPAVATAGHGSAGASAAPSPSADEAEQRRAFAACMRENGVEMADPGPDGRITVHAEKAVEPGAGPGPGSEAGAALEKCRGLLPNGGEPPKLSPEDIEKMRAMARCMRHNGVPDFPDPDPATGALMFRAGAKEDPEAVRKASEACRHLGPDRVGAAVGSAG